MATYTVLQDIEAEDKLIGPFSLKQFVFLFITAGLGYLTFIIVASTMPTYIMIPAVAVIVPFLLLFAVLAAPIGSDQPTDVWLIAHIRFLFRPKLRIWSQDGINELVTITVPKKEEKVYTKDFSGEQAKSRLKVLANVIDSRGWVTKNVDTDSGVSLPYQQTYETPDRLPTDNIAPDENMQDIEEPNDILNPISNGAIEQIDNLLASSSAQNKQAAIASMNEVAEASPSGQGFSAQAQVEPQTQQVQAPQQTINYQTPVLAANPIITPPKANIELDVVETPEIPKETIVTEEAPSTNLDASNRNDDSRNNNEGISSKSVNDKAEEAPIKDAHPAPKSETKATEDGAIEVKSDGEVVIKLH